MNAEHGMSESPSAEERRAEDRTLVRAALGGEPGATEKLAKRLGSVSRILAILNRRMGGPLSEHDLADLSQDVLVVIWGKLDSFEGRARLETWASRFCFRELMNRLRRRKRFLAGGQRLDTVLDTVAAPDEAAAGETERKVERIQVALDRLGPPEADVVRLKHFEQRTFKEIGEVLEISPNTAKTYYYRAIAWLRQDLTGTGTGTEERT